MSDATDAVRQAVDEQHRSLVTLVPLLLVLGGLPLLGLLAPVRLAFGITEVELGIAAAIAGGAITVTTVAWRFLGGAHPAYRVIENGETLLVQAGIQFSVASSTLPVSPLWALALAHAGFGAMAYPPDQRTRQTVSFVAPPVVTVLIATAQGRVSAAVFGLVMTVVMVALVLGGAEVGQRLETATRERLALVRELGELSLLRERSRIARDLHDSVGAALASIAWRTAAVASEVPESSRDELRAVAARASQGVDELRTVVWSIHSPERSWSELVAYVRSRASELCAAGPALELEDLGADEGLVLPARVVSDVVGISLEGVRNAVQHARASTVRLVLGANGRLEVQVFDDGSGLGGQPGEGTGLRSMRERAATLGGTFTLEALAPGTRVAVTAPLPARPPA
ncbi:MAG: hypothetical protein JNJ54_16810 [Myxococcaceae bacterium]|nr:hypothetical protein [Myxococcaceae bacterium]